MFVNCYGFATVSEHEIVGCRHKVMLARKLGAISLLGDRDVAPWLLSPDFCAWPSSSKTCLLERKGLRPYDKLQSEVISGDSPNVGAHE